MLMLDCDGTVVHDNQDDLVQAGAERVVNRRPGMFWRFVAALIALLRQLPRWRSPKNGTGAPET